MNKKFRKLILPASMLIASQSFALGLGGLQINSALDEVLNGEIPFVIDNAEKIESIEVAVASFSDYEKVGLDKSYVPSNIKVDVVDKNGQKYVQVSSIGPVSEPIVTLLLVVDWANGHLLREYTILLDPPMFNNSQTNEYSKPVKTNTYVAPQKIETKVESTPQPESQVRSNTNTYNSSSQIVVESGDTLWKIASRYNNVSGPQQMMVAIFDKNPEAFQSNDMNRLRKGAVLSIPDSDQVSMVSNGQAISEVRSHMKNWSRMQTNESPSNTDNSPTSDYGIELIPPSESDSSGSGNSTGNSASNRANTQTVADLNRANEDLVSSNLENSELSSRVRELEKIVNDQKLALTLKDSDLAQLQDQIRDEDQLNSEVASEEMSSDDVWDESTAEENMDDASATEILDDSNETETMDDGSITETMDAESVAESMDGDGSELMDSSDVMDDSTIDSIMESSDEMTDYSDSEDSIVVEDVANVEAETQSVATSPVVNEKSLIDKIMDYKFEGLIGLGALLIGLLGFVFFKRKGDNDSSDSEGFLDSISNEDSASSTTSDEFNSSLDGSSTELDLSNLEDFDELDDNNSNESESVTLNEDTADLSSEDVPDVIVMNDFEDDETEEFDGLDLDLDLEDDETEELESLDLELDLENDETEEFESLDLDFDLNDISDVDLDTDTDLDSEKGVEDDMPDSGTDDLSLDFELDDLDLDDDSDEDFDFDLDAGSEDLEKVTDDAEELDDLVFDTGERTIVEAVESISDDIEETIDDSSEELDDLEFDLSDDLFDTGNLDLDLDDNEDESDNVEDVTELNLETLGEEDLSLDDLELSLENEEMNELDDELETDDSVDNDEEIDIGLDFDDLASDDAIDTKLDLAKAYFEMGDIDGAKQMVTEIIEEGNDEQKSKAENLQNEIEG